MCKTFRISEPSINENPVPQSRQHAEIHILETFPVKTKLLIRIQVYFWEGESDVAKKLEALRAGPQQASLAACSQSGQ